MGVRSEVEVGPIRGIGDAPEQRVAHRSTYQMELIAGRGERRAEPLRDRRHRHQVGRLTGGHGRPAYPSDGYDRAMSRGASDAPRRGRSPARKPPASGRDSASSSGADRTRRRPRLQRVDETSAGGLVVDLADDVPRGALIGRTDRRGRLLWSLPKGHVEPGETPEQAAVREVAEETGIAGEILGSLGTIDFWFIAEGRRVHKTVHHFLLRAVGGELSDADIEVTKVEWVPLPQIADRLAYPDERGLVDAAGRLLADTA